MNRIAMLEKGIPFELQNEIPWHKSETITPQYNPLEKLPILLNPDDPSFEPVYDSSHIQRYIVEKFADKSPRLLTGDLDSDLKVYQIQVLAQGVLDAFVQVFFETARGKDKQSTEWLARQDRKVDGGLKAFEELVKSRKGDWLVGGVYTIADIAVVCSVGQVDFGGIRPNWKEEYPLLAGWFDEINKREYYASTKPVMFDIKKDTVV